MTALLTELKKGKNSFTMIGTAKVGSDTFAGLQQPKNGSTWVSVRSSLPIEISEGVTLFPRIEDGYHSNKPMMSRFSATKGEGRINIPFQDRLNKEVIEKVSKFDLFTAMIEKDDSGKPITKSFLHGADFEAYLKANLKNGDQIRITGETNYSYDKDREKVYRNYKVKSVRLNEGYKKNGEDVPPAPASATINQTYLLEAGALSSRWEKDLESTGKTAINVHVADYVSTVWDGQGYVDVKKTLALPQVIHLTADPSDETSLKRSKVLAKRLFDAPKRKIRELNMVVQINEGSETTTANIEIDKDLQELIDLKLMTEEDVVRQITVLGNRVSEIIFIKPHVKLTDEGNTVIDMDDDKYTLDVLLFPSLEELKKDKDKIEDVKEDLVSKIDNPTDALDDDMFNNLFKDVI